MFDPEIFDSVIFDTGEEVVTDIPRHAVAVITIPDRPTATITKE